MKIILLIDSLRSGGAQRQIAMLANYLVLEKKCDVKIVTFFSGNHFPELTTDVGISVTIINKRFKFDIFLFVKLFNYINKSNVDVLCTFLFTPSFYGILVKLFSGRKFRLIVSERSYERNLNFVSKITRYLYRYTNFITANSQSQTNLLKTKYPFIANKIYFIKNGVDSVKYAPKTIRNYVELSVACIGRIEEMKNPLCVIETINILKRDYNLNLVVRWAGNLHASKQNNFYFDFCNKKLLEYNIVNNWFWLGVVKEIKDLLDESELLIHPSLGEGFPNTICEAMSSGIIVFASNILDHPLIIKDNLNGFLFNPNNPNDLALSIYKYSKMKSFEKILIRKNAREFAINEFSYSRMGESYFNLFLNN